jgi:sugar lactone lactonase YvrE
VDQSFARYRLNATKVERLATGFRWSEGPVWFGDGRYVLWSDIPDNRIMRWDEETGMTSVFRKASNFANGNTRDRQGRLLSCEHGPRRVSRICPSAAPTSASAARIATGCSWRRARRSIRCTSTRRACSAAERNARSP